MGLFTLSMILAAVGGGLDIFSKISQGKAEREQAAVDTARANQQAQWQQGQIQWQQNDLSRQKGAAIGSLLTSSAAAGISGPSVSAQKGFAAGEYNRAISRLQTQSDQIETQKGWNNSDLDTFSKQSKFNQWTGIAGSLLTTGSSMYGSFASRNYNTYTKNQASLLYGGNSMNKGRRYYSNLYEGTLR